MGETSRAVRAAPVLAFAAVLVSASAAANPAPGAATSGARRASVAPVCWPSQLNTSAALAGGAVTVSPAPESMDASYRTQISFLGVPPSQITDVEAVGSRSGLHPGTLAAYSQGDGASFLPSSPFAQGEVVTVHAGLLSGSGVTPLEWHFTVAEDDSTSRSLETPPPAPPQPKPVEHQHFVSRPDLQPPAVTVTVNSHAQVPQYMFLAPYAGPGQYGPMILDSNGVLVWFRALPPGARAANLGVQRYEGEPVLTWWQDPVSIGGRHEAADVIADSSYRDIAVVRGGNGYQPDLHSFQITSRGTALITVYDAIRCNLSSLGGPANGAVADTVVQEIDLRTGLVRFEWHSLDHVSLSASYQPIASGGTPRSPWDDFHINMVDPEPGGDLLVDSRNDWAAYQVDGATGQVLWTLGGKDSSYAMGPGAAPAWQHDALEQPDGTVTMFDNGATPKVHPQSRAIVLAVDQQQMTVSLLASFVHPSPPLSAPSQGDVESLGGDWFVGWGQEPYFSEFGPTGRLLFDAHLPGAYQSYTVQKFPWAGHPARRPALGLRPRGGGGATLYASWNGATAVARWVALGGSTARRMTPLASASSRGFETPIALGHAPRYVAVRALDAGGRVLATSAVRSTNGL